MRLAWIIFFIIVFAIVPVSYSQDNYSIAIEIRYEGVQILRENTQEWLALPENALAFIGAGDVLRTDAQGRVDILIDASTHFLMLSNSDFSLKAYTVDDGAISLNAQMNGIAIVQYSDDTDFASFELELNDMSVIRPANLMSIWSYTDEIDTVTVALGSASILRDDVTVEVSAASGYRAEADRDAAIQFIPTWNAARLEAQLYGCKGEVQTTGNTSLLVRTGPGAGFFRMGTLDVSRVVSIMGVTESGFWTRIQFLTGFGWIQSLAIKSDCRDVPVFPDDAPEEKFVSIYNVLPSEIEILEPFLMSPADNAFVYRIVVN